MIKWQIGSVKLANGRDAVIHRFCENRQRYLGEWAGRTGEFYAAEWNISGQHTISGVDDPMLDLCPPGKKTVRIQKWINVNSDGTSNTWDTKKIRRQIPRS
jgi:hypothetical protein